MTSPVIRVGGRRALTAGGEQARRPQGRSRRATPHRGFPCAAAAAGSRARRSSSCPCREHCADQVADARHAGRVARDRLVNRDDIDDLAGRDVDDANVDAEDVLVGAAAELGAGDADRARALRLARVGFGDRAFEDVLRAGQDFAGARARAEARGVELLLAHHAFVQAGPLDDAELAALHQRCREHVGAAARRDLADAGAKLVDRDRHPIAGLARQVHERLRARRRVDSRRFSRSASPRRRSGMLPLPAPCSAGRDCQCLHGRSLKVVVQRVRHGRSLLIASYPQLRSARRRADIAAKESSPPLGGGRARASLRADLMRCGDRQARARVDTGREGRRRAMRRLRKGPT